MQNPQDVQLAAAALGSLMPPEVRDNMGDAIGIVLGTGLSSVADTLAAGELGARIGFAELPGFPLPGVSSHAGAFICGKLGERPVLAQQGRSHLYEGRTAAEVCMGVRVMGALGIGTVVLTNAAGALNPLFCPGTLMCMSDIINHTGISPLTGANHEDWGERFPDMTEPLDRRLREVAASCALDLGIRLEQGIYIGVHGPEMETPAETRMYRQWGADAIGMSTVLEIIAARHMGMRVLGISCLTNRNLPDCMSPAPLSEVLRVAAIAGENLARLLSAFCASL